jgi:segregation and condensation protein B
MEDQEAKPIIEALLFVSPEPVSVERLQEVLEGMDRTRIQSLLEIISNGYEQNGHGLQLVEVAGGYQLTTKQECAPWIRRLDEIRTASRLSKPGIETIAIIAYKQPITRAEIEEIRGVDTSGVIKTLLERRLIKIAGRREAAGRPLLYGTTKEFLEYFGLRDLSGLPSLKEFKEVAQAEAEPVMVAAENETVHSASDSTNGNK